MCGVGPAVRIRLYNPRDLLWLGSYANTQEFTQLVQGPHQYASRFVSPYWVPHLQRMIGHQSLGFATTMQPDSASMPINGAWRRPRATPGRSGRLSYRPSQRA